jgi:hypothetical protein
MVHNPSLRQEPRTASAAIIPLQQESSILDWLENTGRLISRETTEYNYGDDEEEINELMAGEDNSFDLDDDDDDLELED